MTPKMSLNKENNFEERAGNTGSDKWEQPNALIPFKHRLFVEVNPVASNPFSVFFRRVFTFSICPS